MIKTENSTDLSFGMSEHITQCHTFIDVNNVIFFTNVLKTKDLYYKAFSQSFCRYEFRETFLYETNINLTTLDQNANGWIAYVREQFYAIPQVESIYYTIDDTDVDIWLIIPARDFNLLCRLVDLGIGILDIFSIADLSLYRFEFHILYRNSFNDNQIVPKRALRLPK